MPEPANGHRQGKPVSSARPILHVHPLLIRTLALAGLLLQAGNSQAQPVTTAITPSGLNTKVEKPPPGGKVWEITGGTRRGTNLFHSFDLFSVGGPSATPDTAQFKDPTRPSTTNILARVTGGRSSISGIIDSRTFYSNANLFLINPAGWIFGPTASLNVGGSFHVSTANYLKFADGAKFFADLSHDSVLTAAAPAAFGFLGIVQLERRGLAWFL